jgi:multicomponent Na+:H+ antiporter subunit D
LLIKIYYRVIGLNIVMNNRVSQLAFLFGVIGMIMGSVNAIFAHDLRRMIAFSSVAQIGYIYAGLGLGVQSGYVAAIYHMIMHAFAKSALFMSATALSDVSGDSKRFSDLRGAGFRHPVAGVCFCVAAMSLVGVPVLGGFVSKLYLSDAAFASGGIRMWVMLIALAFSTLLNVLYLMKTVITLYRPAREGFVAPPSVTGKNRRLTIALIGFIILNVVVGLLANPIMQAIRVGLQMFS